ncbi:Putative NTF2-like domain superfamily protein [Septoria linicola]|uniref:NTF2-like domain superfamily protein n=1 Tax=Septoria linicola TaxID=215465 RepID=A0A9Q9AW92_9PEZI|nr:putative NTF2-like domain superfamily protein [Septoria linicola]USW53112.1 Putative NTF2-like domain superfamily protein [Septoria linicola]
MDTANQDSTGASHDPFEDKATVVAQITQIVHDWIVGVNNRDLDYKSPVWSNISPDFRTDQPLLSVPAGTTKLDFRGILESLRYLIDENPDYHVRISGLDVSLHRPCNRVIAWVNQVISGHPKGVIRYMTGVMTFTFRDGGWQMIHYEAPIGMSGTPGYDMIFE